MISNNKFVSAVSEKYAILVRTPALLSFVSFVVKFSDLNLLNLKLLLVLWEILIRRQKHGIISL